MEDNQREAFDLVRESDRITKEKHGHNNAKIDDVLHKRPVYEVG